MGEHYKKHHIDGILENTAVLLAGRYTRRSFLGQVAGIATATLLGGAVILGENRSSYADAAPTGWDGTYNVNVCYTPWKVKRAEDGYSGIVMRKGPSFKAPPLYKSDGSVVVIPVGEYFGRMSGKTGYPIESKSGCPDPGPLPAIGGFIWGYKPKSYSQIGWIPSRSSTGIAYSEVADKQTDFYACGPAADFDCRDGALNIVQRKVHCPDYHGVAAVKIQM